MALAVSAEGADCAEQPRQISKRTKKERRSSVNRNRLSIRALILIISHGLDAGRRRKALEGGLYPARRRSSTGRRAFMEPERKPSRSRVMNLNPRALKIRVNSA